MPKPPLTHNMLPAVHTPGGLPTRVNLECGSNVRNITTYSYLSITLIPTIGLSRLLLNVPALPLSPSIVVIR